MKVGIIGYTSSGKSTLIGAIARLQQSGARPPVSHQNTRGTAKVESYQIDTVTFFDTPGFHDANAMDDKFVREIHESNQLTDLDCIVYCFKTLREPAANQLHYHQVFGNVSAILVINDNPFDDEKPSIERIAREQIEGEGLTANSVPFIPAGQIGEEIRNLYARIREHNHHPSKINFHPAPLTQRTQRIVRLKRQLDASIVAARPREDQLYCSQGMSNGAEHHQTYTVPSGRVVQSVRVDEYSVNDGDNKGYSRITAVGTTGVHVDARMPEKRGGFLGAGQENQWRDAKFFVTHVGFPDSTAEIQLGELNTNFSELYTDIMGHWNYYNALVQ